MTETEAAQCHHLNGRVQYTVRGDEVFICGYCGSVGVRAADSPSEVKMVYTPESNGD